MSERDISLQEVIEGRASAEAYVEQLRDRRSGLEALARRGASRLFLRHAGETAPEGLRYSERVLWDDPRPTQRDVRKVLARLARVRASKGER